MKTQLHLSTWRKRSLTPLLTLALLLSVALALRLAKPVLAATITLADQASCEALGGRWNGICRLGSASIAAGDTHVTQVWTEVDGEEGQDEPCSS